MHMLNGVRDGVFRIILSFFGCLASITSLQFRMWQQWFSMCCDLMLTALDRFFNVFISIFRRLSAWFARLAQDPYHEAVYQAKTYEDWRKAIIAYENATIGEKRKRGLTVSFVHDLLGVEEWRKNPRSDNYNSELVHNRLMELREAFKEGLTPNKATALLGAALFRNLGDACNDPLFSVSCIHTKQQIEDYVQEMCRLLEWIYRCPSPLRHQTTALGKASKASSSPNIGQTTHAATTSESSVEDTMLSATEGGSVPFPKEKYDFFQECIRTYGRTAIILRGSLLYNLCHLGVAKALFQAGLLPDIVCGIGLGGIITAALLCVSSDDQLVNIFDHPDEHIGGNMREEHSSQMGTVHFILHLIKHEVGLDKGILDKLLKDYFDSVTFKEAHERTGRELNIVLAPIKDKNRSLLLNRFTFPDVLVASVISAVADDMKSGKSMNLLAKSTTAGQPLHTLWSSDLPWEHHQDGKKKLMDARLAELCHVNNYITSEVKPLVQLRPDERTTLYSRIFNFVRSEILLLLELLNHMELLPSGLAALLRRDARPVTFSGSKDDLRVTLTSSVKWTESVGILRGSPFSTCFSLTKEECLEIMRKGERATWAELNKLKVRTKIERTMEEILKQLSAYNVGAGSSLDQLTRRKIQKGSTTCSLRAQRTKSLF